MSALAIRPLWPQNDRPWWLQGGTLVVGAGLLVAARKLYVLRQQPWAPWEAELVMLRTLWRDGWRRVFVPSEVDGSSSLTLRERLQRVEELRMVLKIERNHQIDIAKRGRPGKGSEGWGETTGLNHMRYLPGLVFRGEDTQVAAAYIGKKLDLQESKLEAFKLQQERESTPVMKDVVLVGGGHSHVNILRMLGMDPMPGVRVTLITRDVETPYSGMLPGHIAGLYTRRECHIDLNKLARFARVRLIHATATGIDLTNKKVMITGDRPPISYDVLSINIGSAPRVQGSTADVTPVKPIDGFGARWDALLERVTSWSGKRRIIVVGGGAGGFELVLAIHARLGKELAAIGSTVNLSVELVSRSGLLPQHTPGARALAYKALSERGVPFHSGCDVVSTENGVVVCADGRRFQYDECIVCTQGSPQSWVGDCGLQTDKNGFLLVDQHLRCTPKSPGSDCGVIFAGGDIASVAGHDRPKAGVFAVMAGMALWLNVRATLRGERLLTYWPQSSFLGLLGLGDGGCIASRGTLATEGNWLWELKDWIDRKWMWDYSDGLPEMLYSAPGNFASSAVANASGPDALSLLQHTAMRCGGCGAKVGATTLSRAMARVETPAQPSQEAMANVLVGVGDDAAVVELQSGKGSPPIASVQTIDFFRSFIDDPYMFGRIATVHALSDCEAMGAIPQTALALAQLPYALEEKTEEDIVHLMSGAAAALRVAGCALVGGHTCEAKELGLGMAVTGHMPEGAMSAMRKGGWRPGDVLVLTKPLGTGALFAADMRAKARGPWVMAALSSMATSNGRPASILRKHGAVACTDVTGFGLIGHLLEMCRASETLVTVDIAEVPLYNGALECVSMGITSSLQPANTRLRRAVANHAEERVRHHAAYPLLFDPQTSGGLLAGVPQDRAADCVKALRESGEAPYAAIIGAVTGPAPKGAAADAGHITVRVTQ